MYNFGYVSLYAVYLILFSLAVRRVVTCAQDWQFSKRHGCKPAQSVARVREPFLGIDHLLEALRKARAGRFVRFSASRYARYGNTHMTRRALFETAHTIEPENLKYMLATGFDQFRLATMRVRAMVPLFGSGIFTTDGPAWAHSRAILRPSFTRQNMAPLLAMMERHFQMLLRQVPRDGAPFDMQRLFFCFTMDTATEFLMGGSTHTLDPEHRSDAEKAFADDYLACCLEAVRQIAMGPLQRFSITPRHIPATCQRAFAYVDEFVDKALALRSARKAAAGAAVGAGAGAEYNFIEELAGMTTDRTLLRDQVLSVLLASRDTTAALLSNLFYELARHPAVYAKLRNEIHTHLPTGELPTEAAMNAMPYLRWCINEALRLYPVVPCNTREAACDTALPLGGGPDGRSPLFIKKGTPVLYNVYAMHRRTDIYGDDANAFRPERWDGLRPGWGFLPFNGGPRVCLGQQFALTEASYVITRMLQCFDSMQPKDFSPWAELYSLVMTSKNGVIVSMTPAASSIAA
ncbi:cytochrome P450 [Lasiosphaeris hirsuta]|uniref:Cytochrome P450 n=1 Tax=Lasiosphaeris hirsuta TaxID=260670 RepID=A0AA40A3Q6_9PEZI|nr:cytochrome P450 [Lasiosphaeris hirsuta]